MRHTLTDYEPKITASTKPILPARPTIRAQRQAAGEFEKKRKAYATR
jgi:hypothetical protein